MREQLLQFLARREEQITVAGATVIVREVAEDTDTTALADGVDSLYKFIVRCVFDANGNPVFTDEDIPALKQAGKVRLRDLAEAVARVNGWDVAHEIKNSEAGPSAG